MSNFVPEKYPVRKSAAECNSDSFSPISKQLQKEIESIICVVADKKSIPALINLLDDNDYEIRWIAAEGLIRIGRMSIPPLLRTINDGKHFSHPGKAHHVLQCLLTRSEKKSMHSLLTSLSGSAIIGSSIEQECSEI